MSPLVDVAELEALLAAPHEAIVLVDCRFSLADSLAGRRAYDFGHLPGAVHADLNRDLSGPVVPGVTGRHPLPEPRVFADFLERSGVRTESRVVAYDDAGGAFAARFWWLCRYVGFDRVQVLDGGIAAWTEAGLELSREEPASARGHVKVYLRPELVVTADEVEQARNDPARRVFDARGADRFRGENETIDPVAGHVPGARSLPFVLNLEAGRFRSPAALAARFGEALGGAPAEASIVYCGSGVTACHDLLAAEVAGFPGMKLYAGSFSEWITDPRRPVATGD